MNKFCRYQPKISVSWVNRLLKTSFLAIILMITFFNPFSSILVEGSLSAINGDINSNFNPDNETIYPSSQDFLVSLNPTLIPILSKKIIVTAYSSTPDQTDDTPFITASGKVVNDGTVASNFLAFGTKVRFPQLYGDKIFVVEDRMHERFSSDHIDIWMPTRESAQKFGVKETIMEILE
jgi:3D (Asp-Asp-Asp) domain-containing protein